MTIIKKTLVHNLRRLKESFMLAFLDFMKKEHSVEFFFYFEISDYALIIELTFFKDMQRKLISMCINSLQFWF